MGIEDDFYATIKFKSGEEIYAKVAASDEGDRTLLLLHNPIVIEEVKARGSIAAYKFEPWLKSSNEDLFIIKFIKPPNVTTNINDLKKARYYFQII